MVALTAVGALVHALEGRGRAESGGTTGGVPVSISMDRDIIFGGESAIGWVELDGENFQGEEFQLAYNVSDGLSQDSVLVGRQIKGFSSEAMPLGDNYLAPFVVRAAHNKNCTIKVGVSTVHGVIDAQAPPTAPKQPTQLEFKRWPANPLGEDDIPTSVTASIANGQCTITVNVDRSTDEGSLDVYLVYPYGAHLLGNGRPAKIVFAQGDDDESVTFALPAGGRKGRVVILAVANAVPKVVELTVP